MTAEPVTPAEAFDALERVLDSDEFYSAPQSRNFLAFVVTETLAGRGDRLSERTVGRRALDRPDDFDGRFDASVRVRATRVRKALAAYYESRLDPVHIVLPSGTYQPEFRRTVLPPPAPTETAVVITTDTNNADSLVEAMAQEMARQLTAFPGLRVIGPIPSDKPSAVATRLRVRFALHVAMTVEKTSVELVVMDATSQATVWTTREPLSAHDSSGFEVGQWAQSIVGQIGDFTGVILKRQLESQSHGNLEWQAMQSYYAIYSSGDRHAVIPAAQQLTEAVNAGHRSPSILAALAHALSVRAGYEFSADADADLDEAVSFAREALADDPGSATAQLALATAALVRDRPAEAQEHALAAAAFAPYHPSLLQTAGTLIALAGDWEEGIAVIRQALRLNPQLPGYMRQLLVLDHLFTGDDALALAEASRIETPSEVWGPYFRALALIGLGYRERANAEMREARSIEPAIVDGQDDLVQTWVRLSPEQLQMLTDRVHMFATPSEGLDGPRADGAQGPHPQA